MGLYTQLYQRNYKGNRQWGTKSTQVKLILIIIQLFTKNYDRGCNAALLSKIKNECNSVIDFYFFHFYWMGFETFILLRFTAQSTVWSSTNSPLWNEFGVDTTSTTGIDPESLHSPIDH